MTENHNQNDYGKLGPGEVDIYEKPFDLHSAVSNAVDIFGDLGSGDKINCYAKYLGVETDYDAVENKNEIEYSASEGYINQVGIIIGDKNERVVIEFDTGFLGWLNPDQYEIVNVVEPEIVWVT